MARRDREDFEFRLTVLPQEAGLDVDEFVGGFLEHNFWPLRRGLEGSQSILAVME